MLSLSFLCLLCRHTAKRIRYALMQTLSNFIDLFDVFTIKFEWQKDSGAYGEHFNELIKYLGLSDLKYH